MLLHTWFPWMDVLLYDRKLNPYTHKDWDTSTVPAGWMVVIILTSWLTSGRLDARDAKAQDKYTNFFSTMKSHVNQIEYIYMHALLETYHCDHHDMLPSCPPAKFFIHKSCLPMSSTHVFRPCLRQETLNTGFKKGIVQLLDKETRQQTLDRKKEQS